MRAFTLMWEHVNGESADDIGVGRRREKERREREMEWGRIIIVLDGQ